MCGPFWLSAVLGSRTGSIGVSKTERWLSPSDPRVSHSASRSLALTPNPNLQKRARGWGCGSVVQHAQSPGFNPQQPPPLPVQLVIIHLIRLLRRRHEGCGGAMLHTGTALLRNYSCAYNINEIPVFLDNALYFLRRWKLEERTTPNYHSFVLYSTWVSIIFISK